MSGRKFFTLSFDDGVEQDKILIERMKQYGLKGTFNLNAGLMGQSARFVNIRRIPKDEIRQVYEGFEVASHGYRHENFKTLSADKVRASLDTDLAELAELVGYPMAGHAYPYSAYTASAEECLRGHRLLYARKVHDKPSFAFPANPFQYTPTAWFNAKHVLRLIDEFVRLQPEEDDLLFMLWGHGFELNYGFRPCSIPQLDRIFSAIAGHSDIVYCTNREAFAHRTEGTPHA